MNQKEDNIKILIWNQLASSDYGGFFITAEIVSEDHLYPVSLDKFIREKLNAIQAKGISGRKFVFKEGNWKIYITFFPRNEVVNERYALKNRVFKQMNRK